MRVSRRLSFSGDRATSGTAEPTQMRQASTAEASIHHGFALLTVVTMSLKFSEPTTMNTAMNATAIVKIVRGRKRCRSAVGAVSASESPTRAARSSPSRSERRRRWLMDAGRTGFWMTGAHAISVSSPTQRRPASSARSGPTASAVRTSICAMSIDWFSSVVATSPESQSRSHTSEDESTTTASGVRARCEMPRACAKCSCSHARSKTSSVAASPSSVSGVVGGRADMTRMIESEAEAIPIGSCVNTPARSACRVVNEERSACALSEGDTHRLMPRRRRLFHISRRVPVSSWPGSMAMSS